MANEKFKMSTTQNPPTAINQRMIQSVLVPIVIVFLCTHLPTSNWNRPLPLVAGLPGDSISSCHMRELELCLVGSASLFQNPNGLPITDAELKRQCEYLKESSDCFVNYTERCLTDSQHMFADLFGADMLRLEQDLCTNGTELRTNYTKHAKCLRQIQRQHQQVCMTDLQVGFEGIHKLQNNGARISTACCNLNRLRECIMPPIQEQCGEDAVELVKIIIARTLGTAICTACRDYDPFSSNCESLLPKIGTKPHNGRNTSAISRIISSYAISLN